MTGSAHRRLVPSPVFLLSSVRSGSTLLRAILDSHSMIRAPHEMHLQTLEVRLTQPYSRLAVEQLGLDTTELEHLLWDRLMHRELVRSGKQIMVDKTPGNVFGWRRLRECWPDAQYVFLLRHPAAIRLSMIDAAAGAAAQDHKDWVLLAHINALDEARGALPGLTVRYEELVAQPAAQARRICDFLDVPWEPWMLEYGKQDHGPFLPFIGDHSAKIHSGSVQSPRPLPPTETVPEDLHEACRGWGYL